MCKFNLGNVVMTQGIDFVMSESESFADEIDDCLKRHKNGDWGDLSDDDKQLNDEAVTSGNDRIFSSYKTTQGKVWIITEWDRSVTTILFPEEY